MGKDRKQSSGQDRGNKGNKSISKETANKPHYGGYPQRPQTYNRPAEKKPTNTLPEYSNKPRSTNNIPPNPNSNIKQARLPKQEQINEVISALGSL